MEINVTQEHTQIAPDCFDRVYSCLPFDNPIAKAMEDAGLKYPCVTFADYDEAQAVAAWSAEDGKRRSAYVPESTIAFLRNFYNSLPLEPFSFELTYEDRRATGNWVKVCEVGTPEMLEAVSAWCERCSGWEQGESFRCSLIDDGSGGTILVESTEIQTPLDENHHCQRIHGWCDGWMVGKGRRGNRSAKVSQ